MLKIRSTADLLSAVPGLLGKPVENHSLVALMITGTKADATLRVDLPPTGVDEAWLDQFMSYIRHCTPDSVTLAVYADDPDSAGCPPFSFTAWVIAGRLASCGVEVKGTFLVHPDYWLDYAAPYDRHPAAELGCTDYLANAVAAGVIVSPSPVTVPWAAHSDSGTKEIADMVALACDENGNIPKEGEIEALREWELLLTGTEDVTWSSAKFLAAYFQHKYTRDRLLAVVLDPDCPDEFEAIGRAVSGLITGALDVARFERAQAVLDQMLSLVPGGFRPNLLMAAAALHWHHGRGTEALAYTQEALAISPRHRLAELMEKMLTRGILSPLAGDRRHWTK